MILECNDDGSFDFGTAISGTYAVEITALGYKLYQETDVWVFGEEYKFEIVLESEDKTEEPPVVINSYSISGTLFDDSANKVKNAEVSLYENILGLPLKTTYSNSDVTYIFSDLEPGKYFISANTFDEKYSVQNVEIYIADSSVYDFDLILDKQKITFKGTVLQVLQLLFLMVY